MIITRVIPPADASAATQELLVEITENVARPFGANSSVQPMATVSFQKGAVVTVNENAVVPVTVLVTVVYPSSNPGRAITQVFTEQFDLGFTATTANNVTLTPGDDTIIVPDNIKCCKARGVKLTTTLVASIA